MQLSRACAALALAACGCGSQTGLLFDVEGPSGTSSLQAGIAQLEFRFAHKSYCDRWIEDAGARVIADVHARNLERAPFEVLLAPPHTVNLDDPVLALALARDASGALLGAAAFDPQPFSLHEYREYARRVDLFDRTQPVDNWLADGGCACVSGAPWIGSGSGQACDQLVVPSFDALVSLAGCELPPSSPESLGPSCDGHGYPITFYDEPADRPLPCFSPNGSGCAVGQRTCADRDGVAWTEQCAPDGNAPVMASPKLCQAYLGCEGCGDQLACFRSKLAPAIEYRCTVHLDPAQSSPAPCADGKWQSGPLGQQTTGGCLAVMLDGTRQPPLTVGFADAGGHAQPVGDCPATLEIEDVSPDPMDDLVSIPRDFYFTVGDSLGHARLTFVRECGTTASLECHSG
ncbi:MAG TPA: hypothetical protein VFF06_25460 [Polyangia bacterium]|nr:hypothetical protein [Polyangia bacterium]